MAGSLTARARKLACLFGGGWGFLQAAKHLEDACGWKISPQTLKRCCYDEAGQIEAWRQEEASTKTFAEAEGDVEFQVDGTTVHTVEGGWKEIRIGAFLKRVAGPSARVWDWATRKPIPPIARSVRVVMQSSEEFGETWRAWAASLGITMIAALTVLADGAKWIWNQASLQFPGARGVLDVFHAIEHLAEATREVHGPETGAALAWKDVGVRAMLGDGWQGVCDWIARWRKAYESEPERLAAIVLATEAVIEYLKEHLDHLGYCERLAKGQTIGSGQIEGACKYVIGRRLKRTGARWRQANAVKMATICSTHYADDWTAYWDARLSLAH